MHCGIPPEQGTLLCMLKKYERGVITYKRNSVISRCKHICDSEHISLTRYIFDGTYANQCKKKINTISTDGLSDSIKGLLFNYTSQSKHLINLLLQCTHLGTHLGNILCTSDKHVMIDSAVKDLNCRLNNLLADFSHCNSDTLSTLFNSYCMNVYGCQLWKFNGKHINTFFTAWRKAIRRIWKIPFRSHNKLVHLINGSHDISIILEKRCIKQSWKMLNSEYELYNIIVKYSMHNANSTLGENVRYFMYKYNLTLDDWNQNINNIYKKVDMYVNNHADHADRAVECVAIAIRELCDMRDSDDTQVFSDSELKFMIDMLCTK